MKSKTTPTQPGESGYVRKVWYLIVALVLAVVVPVYVYRGAIFLRAVAEDPMSRALVFGEPLDPLELARRLNAGGEPVYMTDILSAVASNSGAALPAFPKGRETAVTFTVEDAERHAVVYVPSSYPDDAQDNSSSAAMLVLFHGLNDNCEHFLNATGFLPYAEKHGFVLVSACGSQGYLGTAWNSGTCCGFSDEKPNDIGFAEQIVQEMRQAVRVDPRKVMAVGFSNGAMLAEVLACEAADLFQAVVSIGGVVELRPGNQEGLARCTADLHTKVHRASVLMVHGTSDVMVPWGGNRLLGFPSVEANVAAWAERNGCAMDAVNTTIETKTYTNTIYDTCGSMIATCPTFHPETAKDEEAKVRQQKDLAPALAVLDGVVEEEATPFLHVPVEVLSEKKAHHGHGKQHDDADKARKRREKHRKHHRDDEEEAEDESKDKTEEQEKKHHEGHGNHPHHNRTKRDGKPHGHHGPRHGPHHKGHKHPSHHGPHPPPPPPPPPSPKKEREVALVFPDSGISQIELVRVEGGAHRWPQDDEFSTTDYIIEFGARVFQGYND